MITVNVGPELIQAVTLARKAGRAIMLVGTTGVGKSECLQEAARQQGINYLVRDLSLMEPPDLAGLPIIRDGKTHYAPPSFLPRKGKGLMVFEELNRAPRYTQVPCLQLLTTRTLNDYDLPPGWHLGATMNPEDGYDVSVMDPALRARFVTMRVVADVKSWLRWAEPNSVHEAVREYVRCTPDIFKKSDESNPRAWVYVSDLLGAYESDPDRYSHNALLVGVAGLVGDKLAKGFLETYWRPATSLVPSAKEVLGCYAKVSRRIRQAAKAGDTSFLNSLVHALLLHLQDPTSKAETRHDATSLAILHRLLQVLPARWSA